MTRKKEDFAEPKIKAFIRKYFPFFIPIFKSIKNLIRPIISKIRINRILKESGEIFLEIGAGEKKGSGKWVTLDITNTCDLFWDLTKGLPFPDESVSKIYSSHLFEHFSYRDGQKLLDECMRVLKPGGTFSICVPNSRIYIEAYMGLRTLDDKQFFTGWKPAYNNTTKIDYVNYVAHLDGHHKYMFDEENLLHILESKGFINVRLREFDPNLDKKIRDDESIYAEGAKKRIGG